MCTLQACQLACTLQACSAGMPARVQSRRAPRSDTRIRCKNMCTTGMVTTGVFQVCICKVGIRTALGLLFRACRSSRNRFPYKPSRSTMQRLLAPMHGMHIVQHSRAGTITPATSATTVPATTAANLLGAFGRCFLRHCDLLQVTQKAPTKRHLARRASSSQPRRRHLRRPNDASHTERACITPANE